MSSSQTSVDSATEPTGGDSTAASRRGEPELAGQTVVLIGGSAGIGLETARRARAEGADVVLTGRHPDRLRQAAREVDAQRTAAFDANDTAALRDFFQGLPTPIDHVLVTAGGPHYGPLLEMDAEQVRDAVSGHHGAGARGRPPRPPSDAPREARCC